MVLLNHFVTAFYNRYYHFSTFYLNVYVMCLRFLCICFLRSMAQAHTLLDVIGKYICDLIASILACRVSLYWFLDTFFFRPKDTYMFPITYINGPSYIQELLDNCVFAFMQGSEYALQKTHSRHRKIN